MAESVEQLAQAHLERFNRGDLEGMRADYGPGYVYEESGTGRRVTGLDAMVEVLHGWKAAFPDLEGTIERIASDGGTVALEVVWRGTHRGALATPSGNLPPSGRRVETWGTVWIDWKDGKQVAQRNHVDLLSLLMQVGAMPAAADS